MAEIRPFHGLHYDQSIVGDLAAVICPPYDIITPQMEQELYRRSKYNFVHLEHGQRLPQDSTIDNSYTRSAAILEQWLEQGVLITDEVPAIYLHDHYFTYNGREYKRRGITARVRLEEWHRMIIRPHEGTLAGPKDDRVNLLGVLGVNTSPILAMFEDQGQHISSLLALKKSDRPLISLNDLNGERHDVWAITEPRVVAQICSGFNEKPLYIADGHHRYESALIYRRQRRALSAAASPDGAADYVLMTLVDCADPGLIILPPHRLLRGLPPSEIAGLASKLGSFFDVAELPLDMPAVWRQVDDLLAGADRVRLVLFGLSGRRLQVLTLKDYAAASQMMPYFHSELYKRLAVSVVDHVILEELLGLGSGQDEVRISYNYNMQGAVEMVLAREQQLALILGPVRAETVKAIADAGDRMPRKSTYFYPKLPAGLILNRLV
ncbi:MAG: DUF1015 domain-containing protein [Dehalococcoidales bacterium]